MFLIVSVVAALRGQTCGGGGPRKIPYKKRSKFRQQKNVFIVSREMFGESQVIRTLGGETGGRPR